MMLAPFQIDPLVQQALLEDLGQGDLTTDALMAFKSATFFDAKSQLGTFAVNLRQKAVVSGLDVLERVFFLVNPCIQVIREDIAMPWIDDGTTVARIQGPVQDIFKAERTALNFLQHLSGIATQTRRFVDAVADTGVKITDTRKTTPGLRLFEKKAVRDGGGYSHRFNLGSAVMLKDNHLQTLLAKQSIAFKALLEGIRQQIPHTAKIEVEVDSLEQLQWVLEAPPDIILLDNFSVHEVRQAVEFIGKKSLIEVSGGITLDNVRAYAETGVHFISTSRITAGASPVDIGLDFETLILEKSLNECPLPH